jgi:hypothetical protein
MTTETKKKIKDLPKFERPREKFNKNRYIVEFRE